MHHPKARRFSRPDFQHRPTHLREPASICGFNCRVPVKGIETQAETGALLKADSGEWVQSMKDAGAWNGA